MVKEASCYSVGEEKGDNVGSSESLRQNGRTSLTPVLGSMSTWPFGSDVMAPTSGHFSWSQGLFWPLHPDHGFHHPTFTPLYRRIPHVPSRDTRGLEHCGRLTSLMTFFHCGPIALCHVGSDFSRLIACPEIPHRSETRSESLVSGHFQPSPPSVYCAPCSRA